MSGGGGQVWSGVKVQALPLGVTTPVMVVCGFVPTTILAVIVGGGDAVKVPDTTRGGEFAPGLGWSTVIARMPPFTCLLRVFLRRLAFPLPKSRLDPRVVFFFAIAWFSP